jgi:hypothetical protein
MSGINIDQRMIRKGSVDAIRRHVEANGGHFPADVDKQVEEVARQGPRRWWSPKGKGAGDYFAQRYRQRRHQRTFRPAAQNGH